MHMQQIQNNQGHQHKTRAKVDTMHIKQNLLACSQSVQMHHSVQSLREDILKQLALPIFNHTSSARKRVNIFPWCIILHVYCFVFV